MASGAPNMPHLFRLAQTIERQLRALDGRAQELAEIATNASISTSGASQGRQVLRDIAAHIISAAQALALRAQAGRAELGQASELVLEAIRTDKQWRSLAAAQDACSGGSNLNLVRSAAAELRGTTQRCLRKGQYHLAKAKAQLRSVECICIRLAAALNHMQIEATALCGEGLDVIINLADSLCLATDLLFDEYQAAMNIVNEFSAQLSQGGRKTMFHVAA